MLGLSFCVSISEADAGIWIYENKYWSDDAIDDGNTGEWTAMGGAADTRAEDLDDLGVYTDTDGWFEEARSYITIDGGYYEVDPWTFSASALWRWTAYWTIDGTYDEDGSNYFKFEYTLYYMSGVTPIIVDTYTMTYSSDFNYDSQSISHYGGVVWLDSARTYYLKCKINLYHGMWSTATSDMYYGSNDIDFGRVEFKYYTSGPI